MRYFSFNEYDENGGHVVTMSEEDIRREYYPYWYGKMCDKLGKEYVDKNHNFESCLDDWLVVNWAWEVNE